LRRFKAIPRVTAAPASATCILTELSSLAFAASSAFFAGCANEFAPSKSNVNAVDSQFLGLWITDFTRQE
jgi:PBP1b-binding outer membrane lipoprotein LpoB